MRLSNRYRILLALVLSVLVVTGLVWLYVDLNKDQLDASHWGPLSATMLMVHGGAAMAMVFLLGVFLPIHYERSWRAKYNRITGTVMVLLNLALVITAFALYYLGSDEVRPFISWAHIGIGMAMVVLMPLHIWRGRRAVRARAKTAGVATAIR